MEQPRFQSQWSDIDRTADSRHFRSYLDTATAQDSFLEYKRRSYETLRAAPGCRILDVGCGTGEDVIALAEIVGGTGWVTGIDKSERLILEARKRAEGKGGSVEFRVGDVHWLDFPDNTFDGCRADRVFQHLSDREQALAKMTRVTRPGGEIVVLDPDWEALVVDSPNQSVTRKILDHWCDTTLSGWCGGQLPALFKKARLADIAVNAVTIILMDWSVADQLYSLRSSAGRLQKQGSMKPGEATGWTEYLENADRAGLCFCAATGFRARGRKP
jgi:ubiquinone/menaquinone biosynthesis C-methylase UbiE